MNNLNNGKKTQGNLNESWDLSSNEERNLNLGDHNAQHFHSETSSKGKTRSKSSVYPLDNIMAILGMRNEETEREEAGKEEPQSTHVSKPNSNHSSPTASLGNLVNKSINKMVGKKLVMECYKKAEYNVEFHFSQFIRSFVLHFLFYMVLGPILSLLLLPILGYPNVRNMQFIGFQRAFYIQSIVWLLYVSSMIIYIAFPQQEVSRTLIIILTLSVFFRISIVSFRYGYTSPIRVKLMRSSTLSQELLSNEFVLGGWQNITPAILTEELKAAYWRLEISEFQLRFSHLLNEDWRLKLSDKDYYSKHEYNFGEQKRERRVSLKSIKTTENIAKKNVGFEKEKVAPLPPYLKHIKKENIEELKKSYPGIAFARELYLYAKVRAKTYTGTMALISLIHCLLPFLWNIIYYDTIFGETPGQIFILIAHTILSVFLYAINMLNLAGSEFDLQRKNEVCEALSKVIQWGRDDRDWLPSLHLLCPLQLDNWYRLRRILLDMGKKYFVRGMAYNSLFLVSMSPLLLYFIMIYFDIINAEFPDYWIVALFDILFFLARVYYVIYLAAKVNDQFGKHKLILMRTKLFIGKLKVNAHWVWSSLELGEPVDELLRDDIYLQQFFAQYGFANRAGEEWLDLLIEQIYHIIETLETDQERNPIKLLGFTPTYDFLKGSFGTLLTLLFIIVNKELGLI